MNRPVVIVAWSAVLAASLPNIILREVFDHTPSDALEVAIPGSVAVLGLVLAFLHPAVRPLREFFVLLIALIGIQWVVYTQIGRTAPIQGWLNDPSFAVQALSEQLLRTLVAAAMIGVLLVLRKRPAAFFLTAGDTKALVEPMRGLPLKPTERWNRFGLKLAIFISLGTLVFLVIAGRPSVELVVRVLPLLPVVLVIAALNAFNEEVTFKASFLSVLEHPAGRQQSLLLMAAFFGIGHYYGVPNGIVGVLMAGVLGWVLGKSMLETRGMFWAWFIHFCQDVLIFAFIAGGVIASGGR